MDRGNANTHLAAMGIMIACGAIALPIYRSAYVRPLVRHLESHAHHQDDASFQLSAAPCRHPLAESGRVVLPRRVMRDDESQAITVVFSNAARKTCTAHLDLLAPDFEIRPNPTKQEIEVPQGTVTASAVWILAPMKHGTFAIAVRGGGDYLQFGNAVTRVFGMNPRSIQLLSYGMGSLGPLLTVPWWLERWRGWKRRETPRSNRRRTQVSP
jgi:hypothetical protein